MKLSTLLSNRQASLRQARLANIAFAYDKLGEYARRFARAGIAGEVHLKHTPSEGDACWATLTAMHNSPSVVVEHFTDEDIVILADMIEYVTNDTDLDLVFRADELADSFQSPLRAELTKAGVELDDGAPETKRKRGSDSRGSGRCAQADDED